MKKLISMTLAAVSVVSLAAQKKFTYDDLAGGLFYARSVYGVRSMNDGEHYTTSRDGMILKNSYATGEVTDTLVDVRKLSPEIAFSNYEFSSDEKKILFTTNVKPIYRHSFTADYWIYDLETNKLTPLSERGAQQVAQLSPDGRKAAFVRDNNLFWVDLAAGTETQITSDGRFNYVLNGIPDWVYEEEYSFSRAYEWSPASDKIAFYRTDEERVREYNMNRFDHQLYPEVYKFKYPKAGEENSVVTIHVYSLEDGKTVRMDTGEETDQYIPRIKWTVSSDRLAIFRLNRHQNNFDVLLADSATGESRIVYNEKNDRYVERIDYETVTFLPDGKRYIVKSEKDGYMHLYLYSFEKGELNRITSGEWDVTSMLGLNAEGDRVYFLSCETSPLKRNLYSVKLNGKDKKRLTEGEGTYSIAPSKGFKYFISYFSSATTPNIVTLHKSDGSVVRVLEDNAALRKRLDEYKVPVKEFFTFTTSEGVELNGYMIKPNGFDPSKRYPVFMTQYSGPGSQSVADSWGIGWESVLVQEGYIVACVDGRGTGFRGEEFKKCTYKDLGNLEVKDQIEAARYLGSLDYVDPARIGIYGWSYGGFMALGCILKGNDVFKMAISVAPVTSWRYYDTIYTELYNGLPQENPEGYDNNSPIHFADRLKGKLLIAHGTGDDNVHIQNTYEMVSALTRCNKPFDLMIYPDQNHGMGSGRNHLMRKCIEYVKANL